MTIRTTIIRTKDDLKIAAKLNFNKYSQKIKIYSLLFPIMGLAFAFSTLWDGDTSSKLIMAYGLISVGAICIRTWVSAPNRMLKANQDLLEGVVTLITDEVVETKTEGQFTSYKWYTFYDAIISEEMVLLYVNVTNFQMYPRRFFSEEEYAFIKEKASKIEKAGTTRYRKMSLRSLPKNNIENKQADSIN